MKQSYAVTNETVTEGVQSTLRGLTLGDLISDLHVQLKRYDELYSIIDAATSRIYMKPNVPNAKDPDNKFSESVPGHLSDLNDAIIIFRNLNNSLEYTAQHLMSCV